MFLVPAVREQVLPMSSAMIDRLLTPVRKGNGGSQLGPTAGCIGD
jgi:hypothetical protein